MKQKGEWFYFERLFVGILACVHHREPWLTTEAIRQTIAVAAEWHRLEAELPDPLTLADLQHRPDLAASAIRERFDSGWQFGQPRPFAYPKPTGAKRALTSIDPLGDLSYRQVVRRVVNLDSRLDATVFRSRSVVDGLTWRSRDWRAEYKRYRDHCERCRELGEFRGEVHLDVREHYASIRPASLERILNSLGATTYTVQELVEMVDSLHQLPGVPRGLPIGSEASAPLGTFALVPLDRALARRGFSFVRWVDDIIVWLLPGQSAADVLEIAQAQLNLLGQELNEAKIAVYKHDEPGLKELSMAENGKMLNPDPLRALRLNGELQNPNGATRALGRLRGRKNPRGVDVIVEYPWLVERFPKECARYLRAVDVSEGSWDWAVETLVAPTTPENAAAKVHLANLMPRSRCSGAEIFEIAQRLDRQSYAPVADTFFALAGRSKERSSARRRRALEAAETYGELNARRALLAAFADGPAGRSATSGLRHLARLDRELSATVEWAIAA